MADVFDFKTGQLVKRCETCRYWMGLDAFDVNPAGRYSKSDICIGCKNKANKTQRPTGQVPLSDEEA